MVRIYRITDVESKDRSGYGAKYVAEITFRHPPKNGMFIHVSIPAGTRSTPHRHNTLEEVFIAIDSFILGIENERFELVHGDVVLVEPGEGHWIEAPQDHDVRLIAIKLPNIEDDKEEISIDHQ